MTETEMPQLPIDRHEGRLKLAYQSGEFVRVARRDQSALICRATCAVLQTRREWPRAAPPSRLLQEWREAPNRSQANLPQLPPQPPSLAVSPRSSPGSAIRRLFPSAGDSARFPGRREHSPSSALAQPQKAVAPIESSPLTARSKVALCRSGGWRRRVAAVTTPSVPSAPMKSCFRSMPELSFANLEGRSRGTRREARLQCRAPARASTRNAARTCRQHWLRSSHRRGRCRAPRGRPQNGDPARPRPAELRRAGHPPPQ